MLEQLQELRSRNAPAAEQAAVAAQFGGSAWSLDALHEYLEPGEAAPRAADALRAFEAATQELGVQPTAGYYGDGTRFLSDIDSRRKELGITDAELVRAR